MSLNKVNAAGLREMIRLTTEAGKTLFIEGAPGCGKTAIARAEIKSLGRPLVYECAAYLTQANFGLPCPDGDWLKVLRPNRWFAQENATLIFDEADKLSPMMQQQMAQIAHERRLGDDHLPKGCSVILIGNRTADANGSYGVSNILSSRTARIEYAPEASEVLLYGHTAGWHPLLLAALEMNKAYVNKPDPAKDRFPCSRSWENASDILKLTDNRDRWPLITAAHVGDEATAHIEALLSCYTELTPVAECLRNPDKAGIPKNPAAIMLQGTIVASETSMTTARAALKYLARFPKEVALSLYIALQSRLGGNLLVMAREVMPDVIGAVIKMQQASK